jgi:hypothetical protein
LYRICGTGSLTGQGRRPLVFLAHSQDWNLTRPHGSRSRLCPRGSYRILATIIHSIDQTVVGAEYMIEAFLRPDRACAFESQVDLSTRPSLHPFHDLRQTVLRSVPSAALVSVISCCPLVMDMP